MTVSADSCRATFTGTGSLAVYPFTFRIFQASDLLVQREDTQGNITTLTLGVDYTVSGVASYTGGNVTLVAGNLPTGYILTIFRDPARLQATSFRNQGPLMPSTIEDADDLTTMQMQAVRDIVSRCLAIPGVDAPGTPITLPSLAYRKGAFLAFDPSTGAPIAATGAVPSTPVSSYMATVLAALNEAAARASLGGLTKVVNTMADLRALAGSNLAGSVRVLGYYAIHDGGGGVFAYDSGVVTADNGGTIIQPTLGTGRWIRLVADAHGVLNVKWFGAVGDGSSHPLSGYFANLAAAQAVYPHATSLTNEVDWAAWQAGVNTAITLNNDTVFVPCAGYVIDGLITITQGVAIIAPASQGSTVLYGTTVTHNSSGGFLLWNGNGVSAKGTGGGLRNMLIVKGNGYSGGDAIKLLGTDDNHRPGEMWFENILVYGTGTGLWARGFFLDGTANTTSGDKGVRSVVLLKCRFADCSTNNEYVKLAQATHFTAMHLQIDTGHGTGTTGMTISNDSQNIQLMALVCNGNLIINDNALNVSVAGRVTGLDVEGVAVTGWATVSGDSTNYINKSIGFKVISERSCGSFSYRNSSQASVTGDGTDAAVVCDQVRYDGNNDYNSGTGVFTVSLAGDVLIEAAFTLDALGAGHTGSLPYIIRKNAGGSTVDKIPLVENPYARSNGGKATQQLSVLLQCNYGDTLAVYANVSGSTKTVNIYGENTNLRHTFLSFKYQP